MDRFDYGMAVMGAWARPARVFLAIMFCFNPISLAILVVVLARLIHIAWIAPIPPPPAHLQPAKARR
jgi:hypothetical protein